MLLLRPNATTGSGQHDRTTCIRRTTSVDDQAPKRIKRCYIPPMRIIGLAGWSGSGKTTLLTKVIPRIVARGLRVSTLKHAHHDFDVDVPGKDSHSHRVAGATEVLVGSSRRWALMHELRGASEPTLGELLAKLSPVDLVLIEGYKAAPHPKLEVYRGALGEPL